MASKQMSRAAVMLAVAMWSGTLSADTPPDRMVVIVSPPFPQPVAVGSEASCEVQARYRRGDTTEEAPATDFTDWNWSVLSDIHHYHNSTDNHIITNVFTASGSGPQATVKGKPTLSGFHQVQAACSGKTRGTPDTPAQWLSFGYALPVFEAVGAKVKCLTATDDKDNKRYSTSQLAMVYPTAKVELDVGTGKLKITPVTGSTERSATIKVTKDGAMPWSTGEPTWSATHLSSNCDGHEAAGWKGESEDDDETVTATGGGVSKGVGLQMVPNAPWLLKVSVKEGIESGPVALVDQLMEKLGTPVNISAIGDVQGSGELVDKYADPNVAQKLSASGGMGFSFHVDNLRATAPVPAVPGLSVGITGTVKLDLKLNQFTVSNDPSKAPASQFSCSGGSLDGKLTVGLSALAEWSLLKIVTV